MAEFKKISLAIETNLTFDIILHFFLSSGVSAPWGFGVTAAIEWPQGLAHGPGRTVPSEVIRWGDLCLPFLLS